MSLSPRVMKTCGSLCIFSNNRFLFITSLLKFHLLSSFHPYVTLKATNLWTLGEKKTRLTQIIAIQGVQIPHWFCEKAVE